MNKIVQFVLVAVCSLGLQGQTLSDANKIRMNVPTVYEFTVKDINGNDVRLKDFSGKKLIIVNTASECGLTPQYADLQKLYSTYKDKGLVVIGFPSNDFGRQEPGSNAEIATFCSKNYGVTFPMMEKISVTGNGIHPLYEFLTNLKKNGVNGSPIEWNFQKFLIDENGVVVRSVSPKQSVLSDEVTAWVEGRK